jgi:phosphoglycerol transferase
MVNVSMSLYRYKYVVNECLALTVLISSIAFIFVYLYQVKDFHAPVVYSGDTLYFLQMINNVVQFQDPFAGELGAPFPPELIHFPGVTLLWTSIVKCIAFWSSDVFFINNIFIFSTFILHGIAFYSVTRLLGIRWSLAWLGALIFCFLPFSILRSLSHQAIMPMVAVPVGCYLALLIFYSQEKIFFTNKQTVKKLLINCISLFGACVLVGISGHYWAGFTCIFIGTASLINFLSTKSKIPLFIGLCFCFIIVFSFLLSQILTLVAAWQTAASIPASPRGFIDQAYHGLRVMDLLVPVDWNHLNLNRFINFYNNVRVPPQAEGRDGFIGPIGIIGLGLIILIFLGSFGRVFGQRSRLFLVTFRSRATFGSAILCIIGILFSVTNSFGNLFHLFISTAIRCQNRVAVFIAFFCIFVVLVIIESYYRKQSSIYFKRITYAAFLILIMFSIHVQSGFFSFDANAAISTPIVNKDRDFFLSFNSFLGTNRQILQLPITSFPGPPVNNFHEYEHFRGPLHTSGNRWSYGAIAGRPAFTWQNDLMSLPTTEMLARSRAAGFDVILLERRGYSDNGEKIINDLIEVLGPQAIVLDKDNRVVFDLCPNKNLDDKQLPVVTEMSNRGFSVLQTAPNGLTYRWNDSSNGRAKFAFENFNLNARPVTVESIIITGYDEPFSLFIDGPSIKFTKTMLNDQKFTLNLIVPPGINVYEIWTSARQVYAPHDIRKLYFQLRDFKVIDHNYEALVDRYLMNSGGCISIHQ